MIQLRNITLRRGTEALLERVSTSIYPGHKVGLIGPNGSGKSTLLSMLRGELLPDSGDFYLPKDWEIASMAQETPALQRSAEDFILDGDRRLRAAEQELLDAQQSGNGERIALAHSNYEEVGGYSAHARAGELLHGLGFNASDGQRSVAEFSGGWRVRLSLAQALMSPSDLLLLDEPTNHLDLETVLWLEQWLRRYTGTLIIISHDRDLLDNVIDSVLHIEHRDLNLYSGGYTAFEHQRAEHLARQQAIYEKQQREIAHMQRFIDRFRAKASKARAAQSRIKALERMEKVAPAYADSQFQFRFPPAPQAANPLLTLEGAKLGYSGAVILSEVTRSIAYEDRIGLLGPNGAGKSTLVRALAGEQPLLAGETYRASGLQVGYFAQHQLEQLDCEASPLLHLQRIAPQATPQRLRDFLGSFAFRGDMATSPVGNLSGGEKARLVLALIAWQQPNLLLLDEPTNHLDLEMRHALSLALQDFAGAVVVISHDRRLLAATVDRYWLVANGTVTDFTGDLDDYRDWLTERRREAARDCSATSRVGSTAGQSPGSGEERKAQRRREAEQRAALKPLRERAARLLDEIEQCDQELKEIEQRLADPQLYEQQDGQGGQGRLTALMQQQGALKRRREELEMEWMEAEEEVEQAARELA
ncbi:ATP-binding cassette domain-containing protein [Halorhodospira halochloris]|uniref:ABC-F family ATP-binding cassette domain-containing protein n=1 Tax=Halorhodospira halochloris TaxID=1052 RepID=UPI001EE9017C|nr:ATP-binding cassette domain-containing protein [Halorhodospira halochloris]MCG5531489.1 ATP-binding cassette domain-containing protein [Halorhodospira halochloris]